MRVLFVVSALALLGASAKPSDFLDDRLAHLRKELAAAALAPRPDHPAHQPKAARHARKKARPKAAAVEQQAVTEQAFHPTSKVSLQTVAEVNPTKTKEACEKCIAAQADAVQKQTDAVDAADEVDNAMNALSGASEKSKAALVAEQDALAAYNAAQDEIKKLEAEEADAKAAQEATETAEKDAKAAAAAALAAAKDDCKFMNLDAANTP